MKVPTIYKAYVREYTQNMAVYGTVPPFQDPGIPIDDSEVAEQSPLVTFHH